MVWCGHCNRIVSGTRVDDCQLCCTLCGRILEDFYYSEEATFLKSSSGQSQLSGNNVRTIQSEFSASRQRTLDRARDEMQYLSEGLGVDDVSVAIQASRFYTIALERNFTRGRKSEQVQAACLYIAFRQNDKPYLLIDFSNYIRTNVYVLGAVFLQLCKVLRLEEHPIVQKPVDPSLFIHKYTNKIRWRHLSLSEPQESNKIVSKTALNIIASMKRDWMQTGRKPSGLCGAALYMSVLAHGFKCSKSDILRIVHVCEATLTKRLVEFENTESGSLTIEELNMMAEEHEKNPITIPNGELNKDTSKYLLCEHKDRDVPYFALGLCETCYKDFDKLSGGLGGGLDPPAFQRAERERMAKSLSEESADKSDDLVKASSGAFRSRKEDFHASEPESIGANDEHVTIKDGKHDNSHGEDDVNAETHDEPESLSDIDDQEVDGYLHNEEEKHYKKIIWENMNREYLEEQAAKEAAAEITKANCSDDVLAVKEAVAKSRKETKQRRDQEAKNSGPAQSAVEAASQMFRTKRLSSKVNYGRLKNIFDETATPENPKKVRFELPSDNPDNFESKLEDKMKDDELGSADEYEDGDMGGDYDNTLYNEYGDDGYNNYDDY